MPRFDKELTLAERDALAEYLVWLRTATPADLAAHTLFCLSRQRAGLRALPRWPTLPARGADISGLAFDATPVEAEDVVGRVYA